MKNFTLKPLFIAALELVQNILKWTHDGFEAGIIGLIIDAINEIQWP